MPNHHTEWLDWMMALAARRNLALVRSADEELPEEHTVLNCTELRLPVGLSLFGLSQTEQLYKFRLIAKVGIHLASAAAAIIFRQIDPFFLQPSRLLQERLVIAFGFNKVRRVGKRVRKLGFGKTGCN